MPATWSIGGWCSSSSKSNAGTRQDLSKQPKDVIICRFNVDSVKAKVQRIMNDT